ncbi:MAG TPA: 3-oxoacyl-ACP reductase family protein [bacterium]|nr:3-oxoacyl-ACP reductase family protein [bacterium]
MFDLSGKSALVTGGSRGIGAGVCEAMAAAGARVWVHYNSGADAANEVAAAIVGKGGAATAVGGDIGDSAQAQGVIDAIEGQGGQVDILVNNAGINIQSHLIRMADDQIQQVLNTNLLGTIYCTRAALKGMMKRKWGRLIHISSIVADLGSPTQTIYCATKSALFGFSKALTKEYAGRGITSNVIMPGLIDTAMTRALSEEQLNSILATIPTGRIGQPADIAAACVFLASNEASFISGAELAVNGGAL